MGDAEQVFSRIFALKLYGQSEPGSKPPVLVLSQLAAELEAEAGEGAAKPVLDAAVLDRVLVARLIEAPPADYPQPPIHYLMGCYERSSEELRRAGVSEAAKAAVATARDLILNYAGLALFAGMIPQPPVLEARGPLQLLDALLLRHGLSVVALTTVVTPAFAAAGGQAAATAYAAAAAPMPPGFLEELAVRHDNDEGLQEAAVKMVVELARLVSVISPLGDPAPHLTCLAHIASLEPLARPAARARQWLPDFKVAGGRAAVLPGACWLGPFFNISPIPDDVRGAPQQEPSVLSQCFVGMESRRQGDVANAINTLRLAMKNIVNQLHGSVKSFLKLKTTKGHMIKWLGGVLEGNAGRSKMSFTPESVAPDGFMINVAAVLLKLCGPFLDTSPASPFWKRVDPGFVAYSHGLLDASYANETKLAAASDEEAAWRERVRSNGAASTANSEPSSPSGEGEGHHFICQAFFLTAHALHIGPLRSMTMIEEDLAREMRWFHGAVQQMEAAAAGSTNPMERAVIEQRLNQLRAQQDYVKARYNAFVATVLDPALITDMLAFYRLMAAWLMRVANRGAAGGVGGISIPLPEPAPQEFTCMPEYFVEDMANLLLFVGRSAPQLLSSAADGAGVRLEEFAVFFTSLMASPKYIRSSFLRSKLSEVLEQWLPQTEEEDGRGGFRRRAPSGASADLAALFNCNPLVIQHLTPVLVQLYNDIEHTERAGAFYFKFSMRVTIANILKYLWAQPQHRAVWLAWVRSENYRGSSEKFASMLINDLTYLLDEVLRLLKLLRQAEETRADEAKWAAMSQQERQEHESQAQFNGQNLTALVRSATSVISTLNFVTEEVDTTRTFLQPHMVTRLRDSLNYFLKYLVGPERRQLRVKDQDKYGFNPRELLRGLVTVYLHVDSIDRANPGPEGPVFAKAVGQDGRSFDAAYFDEASLVLDSGGLLNVGQREQLASLAQRALAASTEAEAEDEEMGEDVPEEFSCAILSTIMKDPVKLPSGVVVDRPAIQRHLLSDPTDPFSRQPLSEDQLEALPELLERINAWRKQRSGAGK
ncbi:hypothetical protein HYH02_004382 [Chlamydomonas schloesseri]|uniref:RING-type E3 ubiquitin transferase n=1 Tax=Chlamydomonas schloesseri TaxID=2026947 RepID=A0A835WPP6_9CHLO|nr:hypothetical protein HYH02_004382 [Chlamydomonas schloesseri]|eukprot:KAG2451114.1 hypothetical protein HYH02_004382 [Chlamydomonas schloesseri]